MSKLLKKASKVAGLPPGSLIHIGEQKIDRVRINIIFFSEDRFLEKEVDTIDDAFSIKDKYNVRWISIEGLHQVSTIEGIGERFKLHPLLLEDVMNTDQRPKLDDYEDYLFTILKIIRFSGDDILSEQVSIVVGNDYVISFQESGGDVFSPIKERIRSAKGRVRRYGSDYLAYALIDAIVDNYFIVLEKIGDNIEELEDELVEHPDINTLQKIHKFKRMLIFLRKTVWPLREGINGLQRSESTLFKKSTAVYLRDVYDHTIHIIDTIESFRDTVNGMLDIYLSTVSNRMNEVMKVLTIIATIFIPLTFIAGIYGMNFDFMPELRFKWAYPSVLLLMLVAVLLMLLFFRKKKWL